MDGYDKWFRMDAPVHRCSSMTSNIAENINAALISARELSIYDFLEEVRLILTYEIMITKMRYH